MVQPVVNPLKFMYQFDLQFSATFYFSANAGRKRARPKAGITWGERSLISTTQITRNILVVFTGLYI